MTFFQFQDPIFFSLLLLLPVIAWWTGRTGPEAAVRFSSTKLVKSLSRSRRNLPGKILLGLRLLGLAALIAALARPQIGKTSDSVEAEGIDIVLTLDLSGSMKALDLATRDNMVTRLDAAKKVIQEFIDERPYDRIGLVAFASDAYVVSPLTLNHDWLKKNVQRLELGDINMAQTAIGTALGASVNRLRGHEARSRIIVLLTDGESNAGDITPIGAAEAAKTYDVKVYTIATGREGRVPIPETTRNGLVRRDRDGNPLYRGNSAMSNYNEAELQQIAEMTGGQFFTAQQDGDLERIYDHINELETTAVELRSYASFTEYFMWPTYLGLALLALEQLLSNTRYRRLP